MLPNGNSDNISIVLCEFFLAIGSLSSNKTAKLLTIPCSIKALRPLQLPFNKDKS